MCICVSCAGYGVWVLFKPDNGCVYKIISKPIGGFELISDGLLSYLYAGLVNLLNVLYLCDITSTFSSSGVLKQ